MIHPLIFQRHHAISCLTTFILTLAANAQGQQSPAIPASAVTTWANVVTLATPITPATPSDAAKSLAQVQADQLRQAGQYKQAAQAAKSFGQQYATDVHVPEAKKIEALTGVLGVLPADADQGKAATDVASAYRLNSGNPARDRFEVAVALERLQLSKKTGGDRYPHDPAAMEKLADDLHREFGDLPEAANFYIGVARTVDMATASRMAKKLLDWPAPPGAKAEAQAILDRQALVGKVLDLKLTALGGTEVDLARQAGKPTVILVWSASTGPNGVLPLARYKQMLPKETQVVYLALNSTPEQVTAARDKAPIVGLPCFEPDKSRGAATSLLRIRHTPFVFVLNRAGTLSGFGPVSELPNLLAVVAR